MSAYNDAQRNNESGREAQKYKDLDLFFGRKTNNDLSKVTNVDFNADISALTTKASNILARPEVQAKISSDIASAQEQQSADIQGAITDVTAAAQPIIKEVTPVLEELSGKSLSIKLPKKFPL